MVCGLYSTIDITVVTQIPRFQSHQSRQVGSWAGLNKTSPISPLTFTS